MDYDVVVVPTGNEKSLDEFKHQYESTDWSAEEGAASIDSENSLLQKNLTRRWSVRVISQRMQSKNAVKEVNKKEDERI